VSWSPYATDIDTAKEDQAFLEERSNAIATRMADLAKQMELFDSDDFAWFLNYLEALRERVKSEAISLDDPIKHAEKRAEYRLLAFLIAMPHTTSLEYQALKDKLETLGPDTGTLDV
jgi:hypothetical protein